MKRWFVAVLVFTLGLSLTSCGGRSQVLGGSNLFACDGDFGQFDVMLEGLSDDEFALKISPVAITANDLGGAPSGSVSLATGNETDDFNVLAGQVSLTPGRVIKFKVTADDLYNFPMLVIAKFRAGVPPENIPAEESVACEIPYGYDDSGDF